MHWLFIACGTAFNITICNHCDCDVEHQQKYHWPVIVLKLGSCWKCLFDRDLQLNLTKLAKIRFHHRTILNGEIKRFSEHLEITIQFFGNIKSCKIKFLNWWSHIKEWLFDQRINSFLLLASSVQKRISILMGITIEAFDWQR